MNDSRAIDRPGTAAALFPASLPKQPQPTTTTGAMSAWNDETTDERLVQSVLDGDDDAFAELVRRHKRKIFGMAARFARNDHELDDIYLKKVGWKGFVDGKDSGVYFATPLSRLNPADRMATPRAQEEYEKFFATLGGKPVHQRLAIHWARLVELLYAAERIVELATDPEITSDRYHTVPNEKPTEGVGIVEAPRGTLTHHYKTDERGLLTEVNLIVGTTNNYAPITMSIKKAASSLIKKGNVNEGLLNMVEIAFRAYDPSFGCATHSLPGQMPLEINIRKPNGEILDIKEQFID